MADAVIEAGSTMLSFFYSPERQRFKQITPTETTYYLHPDNTGGLLYEQVTKPGNIVEHKHYISAYGKVVAVYTETPTENKTRYWHTDHLGSVAAITDDTGAVVERLAYAPFGKRRFPSGQADIGNTIVGQNTERGFTTHEHLDEMGVIHMNGRVYDPLLGRFMSADPYVQDPTNAQSYNRYAYGLNNPLAYTDPSGYFNLGRALTHAWKSVWNNEVGRAAVVITAAVVTGGWASGLYESYVASTIAAGGIPATIGGSSALTSGVIGGAVGGFAGGFLGSNGDFEAGLRGAIMGGISGGLGSFLGNAYSLSRVAMESTVGGVMTQLSGRRFAEGFRWSLGFSLLTYGNYLMRQSALKNSSLNPDNISGESEGFFGDGKKLGGARREIDPETGSYVRCTELMGGCQGAPLSGDDVRSNFFGARYNPGSAADRIVEAFAGPHDFFRDLTSAYDKMGNHITFRGLERAFDEIKSYMLVIPAAPFAAAALIPPSVYEVLRTRVHEMKNQPQ